MFYNNLNIFLFSYNEDCVDMSKSYSPMQCSESNLTISRPKGHLTSKYYTNYNIKCTGSS